MNGTKAARHVDARMRHAVHYVSVLRDLNDGWLRGGSSAEAAVQTFETEWPNTDRARQFLQLRLDSDAEAASLYSDFAFYIAYFADFLIPARVRIDWYMAARGAAQRAGDTARDGIHCGNLALSCAAAGDTRRAEQLYRERIRLARVTDDRRGHAAALGNLAVLLKNTGRVRAAIACLTRSLLLEQERGYKWGECETLANLASCYALVGPLDHSDELSQRALELARQQGHVRVEAAALSHLAGAKARCGDVDSAIELYRQRVELARRVNDHHGLAHSLGQWAVLLAGLGDHVRAENLCTQALEAARESRNTRVRANIFGTLSTVMMKAKRFEDAVQAADAATGLMHCIGDLSGEARSLGTLGLALVMLENRKRSEACHKRQLELARLIGDRSCEAAALFALSMLLGDAGAVSDAIYYAQEALRIRRALGDVRTAPIEARIMNWETIVRATSAS
jgi:tetratricopeptide (TPR) repeat protein